MTSATSGEASSAASIQCVERRRRRVGGDPVPRVERGHEARARLEPGRRRMVLRADEVAPGRRGVAQDAGRHRGHGHRHALRREVAVVEEVAPARQRRASVLGEQTGQVDHLEAVRGAALAERALHRRRRGGNERMVVPGARVHLGPCRRRRFRRAALRGQRARQEALRARRPSSVQRDHAPRRLLGTGRVTLVQALACFVRGRVPCRQVASGQPGHGRRAVEVGQVHFGHDERDRHRRLAGEAGQPGQDLFRQPSGALVADARQPGQAFAAEGQRGLGRARARRAAGTW